MQGTIYTILSIIITLSIPLMVEGARRARLHSQRRDTKGRYKKIKNSRSNKRVKKPAQKKLAKKATFHTVKVNTWSGQNYSFKLANK